MRSQCPPSRTLAQINCPDARRTEEEEEAEEWEGSKDNRQGEWGPTAAQRSAAL